MWSRVTIMTFEPVSRFRAIEDDFRYISLVTQQALNPMLAYLLHSFLLAGALLGPAAIIIAIDSWLRRQR